VSVPRIGVIGGGQLARMMAPAAVNLNIELHVLAEKSDDSAAQVIPHTVLGSHHDRDAVLAFARNVDVITFDHEHVPTGFLDEIAATGVAVRPGPHALKHAQDKLVMRQALAAAGIPCPRWAHLEDAEQLDVFAGDVGYPLVLKTARGGYDGKGVWVVDSRDEARSVMAQIDQMGTRVLAEEKVPFVRELAAQVVRSPHGQCVAYPVVQSLQTNGICHEVVSPAPDLSDERSAEAQAIALKVAADLDVTGMLAVELFDTGDRILVNELAMRPHNSGHWTMDGAVTSQFENHLRAVLDWPLGSPAAVAPVTVMVNLLGGDLGDMHTAFRHVMARDPGVKVHLYGKDVRPGRKVGHVNVLSDSIADASERAWHAADYLTGVIDE
jgi:5-(carboxyamino)imidazole ribonucleotide synthase